MAEKPIKTPLPADLPEDWNAGQIVAPDGTTVGLTEQHGYNYLMAAVNRAQSGVNAVNEAFETVNGKRTCRVVVGTSTAGWTEEDCDFLCNGSNDWSKIMYAIDTLPEEGGEIALLGGTYTLSRDIAIDNSFPARKIALVGEPGSSVLSGSKISVTGNLNSPSEAKLLDVNGIEFSSFEIYCSGANLVVSNCRFINAKINYYHTNDTIYNFLLCKGNFFEGTSFVSAQAASTEAVGGSIIIAENTFNAKGDASNTVISVQTYNSEGAIISGNTIFSEGTTKISVYGTEIGAVLLNGNSLCNCGINANIFGWGLISDNLITGGDILLRSGPIENQSGDSRMACSISGNSVKNGEINVTGGCSITGNSVIADPSVADSAAIHVRKNTSNSVKEHQPSIVGNFVVGGKYGIWLENPYSNFIDKYASHVIINSNRIYGTSSPIRIESYWSNCMVTDNMFETGAITDLGSNNIVRFNSDDTSGGGSTPATVQQATPTVTVNADGTVTATATQAAGYVAAGTRSATHQLSSADDTDLKPENIKDGVSIFGVQGTLQSEGGCTAGVSSFNGRSGAVVPGSDDYTASMVGAIPAESVKTVQVLTEAEYNALTNKSATTLYLIKE